MRREERTLGAAPPLTKSSLNLKIPADDFEGSNDQSEWKSLQRGVGSSEGNDKRDRTAPCSGVTGVACYLTLFWILPVWFRKQLGDCTSQLRHLHMHGRSQIIVVTSSSVSDFLKNQKVVISS